MASERGQQSIVLDDLSGAEILGALVDILEQRVEASIGGYAIGRLTGLDRVEPPRDVSVRAVGVAGQAIKFSFGSTDEPSIDYRLQVLGVPQAER